MPFIPHTDAEVESMLAAIGADSIDELFDEVPTALRCEGLTNVPDGLSEMDVGRIMKSWSNQDGEPTCFIGAGAYDHHIPAAVWELATRGEFYSAYTPYQAEASQGTLQLIYEFQTMIAGLTGMAVSNASLYDGASALAEAVLMAVRANRKSKSKKILITATVNPVYLKVVDAITKHQGITMELLPYNLESGTIDTQSLEAHSGEDFAALVIPLPNFFGGLEAVDALTDWAHNNNILVIGVVNPTAMALLKPPGEWGETGADIAVGDGQPLGIPLSSGGPFLGFMACKQALVRQMPGRIVGRTVDLDGKPGFSLTLQAREQHIRRSKATSNICTNQGLMATAATIYMSIVGQTGLRQVAEACHANCRLLAEKLTALDGVELVFNAPYFHEIVVRIDQPFERLQRALAVQDVLIGYDLSQDYPDLQNCILLCATEKRTEADIDELVEHLERFLTRSGPSACSKYMPKDPAALGFVGDYGKRGGDQ
ncbi:MAG: aminomethyl-transferring glycine dehydrogenase subunit GcvPA [Gammaproteobacteria bacterium]|nr:aminomethyl-transferring glycine dehydrogenase subunit GcvPA [Gammaproteobacteria bacterium]